METPVRLGIIYGAGSDELLDDALRIFSNRFESTAS